VRAGNSRQLLLIGLATTVAFVAAQGTGALWRLNTLLQDRFFVWRDGGAGLQGALVEVDTQTLDELGWPISRAHHANLLLYLSRRGARAVGYDVLLSDRRDELGDAALASAAGELSACFAYALPVAEAPVPGGGAKTDSAVVAQAYPLPGGTSFRAAFAAEEIPYDELRDGAGALGHASLLPDPDGLVRAVPLFIELDGLAHPSLSFQLFRLYHAVERDDVRIGTRSVTLVSGGKSIRAPLEPDGALLINWDRDAEDLPSFSMLEVLADDRREAEGQTPRLAGAFRDRVVIVGVTAEALRDSPPTPLGPKTTGCMIHAQALATMVSGTFLRHAPDRYVALAALVLITCTAWVAGRLRSLRAALAVVLVVGATGIVGWQLFLRAGLVLPVAGLMLAEAVAYGASSGYERFRREKEGRQVKAVFGKYVAPTVLDELLERPDEVLALKGNRKELSVVFCDVKGFSALCEEVDPPELLEQLNQYLGEVTEVIFRFEGTVDKFMGDAVMAFFGHPLECVQHPERAVRAALQMQRSMAVLREEWSSNAKPPLHIRIGVHSGWALVGNMGSKRRLDYTVFGPTVNLAQRLEVSCDPDGVLISEATLARVRGIVRIAEEKVVEAKNIGSVKAYQVAGVEES
jgi:adenylate cyclase